MTAAPALPTKLHTLLNILGEGTVLFLVGVIGTVVPWVGKPISKKTYIAICGLCAAIWVVVAAVLQ